MSGREGLSSILARFPSLFHQLIQRFPVAFSTELSHLNFQNWLKQTCASGREPVGRMAKPSENKSYLSDTFSAFSPWGRSSTKPPSADDQDSAPSPAAPELQQGGDHRVTNRHRLSLRHYPTDCPKLDVQWFHAVDVSYSIASSLITPY